MARFVEIMIVEDEDRVRESFRLAFAKYPGMTLVYETDSELRALDYLETHGVDVVILDIELKEGDGLSFLDEIEVRGLEKPFIVVVTNTGSQVTLSYMRTHGADYIYQKTNRAYSPIKVLSVIEKIYPYQQVEDQRKCMHALATFDQEKEDAITKKYIEDELVKMGFRRKHVGFDYAVEAIFLLIRDKESRLCISSEVYGTIAQKHHTTRGGVERGIRNAIEAAFTDAAINGLHRHYPFDYDKEKGRPTNTEFLKNMAERLRV